MKGLKTLLSSAAITAVGVANMAGAIDLHPLLTYVVKDEAQVGAIMVVLAVVFAGLRLVTTTPVASSVPVGEEAKPTAVDAGV